MKVVHKLPFVLFTPTSKMYFSLVLFVCCLSAFALAGDSDELESQCDYACPSNDSVRRCCMSKGFASGYCDRNGKADCEGTGNRHAAKWTPRCSEPCRTGGHVGTCCKSHGFSGGNCLLGAAFCTPR